MELITRISYKEIFNNKLNYKTLLNKINLNESLKIITSINKQEYRIDELYGSELNFIFNFWLKNSTPDFKKKVANGYDRILKKSNSDIKNIRMINRLSSLRLIEILLFKIQQKCNDSIQPESNYEENLFRLYLLINDEISEIQEKAFKPFRPLNTNIYQSSRFHLLLGLTQDLVNAPNPSKLLFTGVLKFIQFEKWLREYKEYEIISKTYIKRIGLNNWYEYFNDVFQINKLSINSLIISSKSNPNLHSLLIYFSKMNENYIQNYGWDDLMYVRKNPVYRLNKNEFLILDLHFMLDKLFSGVYHDLLSISKEKNINSFHQNFNKHFLEEFLFINSIKSVFGNSYIKFSEIDIKNKAKKNISNLGLPDYYIRNGNKVLLFECKNSFISLNNKLLLELSKLEKEIQEKFYYNKKRKKAVKQLTDNIKNIELGKYTFFDNTKKTRNFKYYPIIIVTDPTLCSIGINKLLIEFMEIEKEKVNKQLLSRIKNLTVIHIDDLLHFSFKLKKLTDVIDKYQKFILKSKLDHMISFSDYLNSNNNPVGYAKIKKNHIEHMLKDSLLPKE